MPQFAANLSWLFTEVDFPERFAAASRAGFKGVECLFPYDFKAKDVANWLADNDLKAVLINAPPGDWSAGERGLGCLVGREADFRDSLGQAIEYALTIKCPKIHIMAGIEGEDAADIFFENLNFAARTCGEAGLTGLIEPINDMDMPGYFLTRPDQAMDILATVDSPHLGLQLDLYHAARMGYNPALAIDACKGRIAHFQVAGVPDRFEPNVGKVDFSPLFNQIDALDYTGWIGCEYKPMTTTTEGLGWLSDYL